MLKKLLGDLFTPEIEKALEGKQLAVVNDGSYIPREKFNEATNEAKELKKQLAERDTQLKDLETKAAGNEDLTKQINEMKAANEKAKADYDAALKGLSKQHAIDKAIAAAKGKNPKAVKALLDLDKVSLDGENVLGLAEQIKALQESDAYLFDTAEGGSVGGGTNPPGGGNAPKNIDQQIEEAIKAGDIALSLRLKNQKYFKD